MTTQWRHDEAGHGAVANSNSGNDKKWGSNNDDDNNEYDANDMGTMDVTG